MKKLNELEARLRSWTPRQPSLEIRARLFPVRPEPAVERRVPAPVHRLGWLAPAFLGLALAAIMLPRPDNGPWSLPGAQSNAFLATAAVSNQLFWAYQAGGDNLRWNPPPEQIGMDKPGRFDF